MDRIDAMQAFVTVADLQGFAPAARKLGLSPSGVTRLIQSQLFGVEATDLLSMAVASLGIGVVTALAGYLPARRATMIDPMHALRWE